MKKIAFMLILLTLVFSLISCDTWINIDNQYDGEEVTSLTYQKTDYMGGSSITYVFDFVKNTVKATCYEPMSDTTTTVFFRFFTEIAEKRFIGAIYAGGLFDIKDKYITYGVSDGSGWELEIAFADGTSKKSTGSNAGPGKTFAACSQAFVDICGRDVLGNTNHYIYMPPTIKVSYNYTYNGERFVYSNVKKQIANGKWNGREYGANDTQSYYELNENSGNAICVSGCDYNIVIDTSEYGEHKEFVYFQITSYNYDSELSDMRVEKSCEWFDSVELEMELDRIYVIMFEFDDGDFLEYTFNTRFEDSKP